MRQIFFCIIHKKQILSPEGEVFEATPLSVQSVQIVRMQNLTTQTAGSLRHPDQA